MGCGHLSPIAGSSVGPLGESGCIVPLSYDSCDSLTIVSLPPHVVNVTVHTMYTVARFLQMVGLTIPLFAIIAQLNQAFTASKMLGFLIASVLIFSIGHLIQRSTGGPQ